ncbi:MAG: hypothetical protein WBB28_11235 [Crinalium sp.]
MIECNSVFERSHYQYSCLSVCYISTKARGARAKSTVIVESLFTVIL